MSSFDNDPEVKAMGLIVEALAPVKEKSTLKRILDWAYMKYLDDEPPGKAEGKTKQNKNREEEYLKEKEIPGIAKISDAGDLNMTIRNLKAKNTNDAAIRLAHIIIYSNLKLTGEESVSSRKVLTPILKEYRVYNGNVRGVLAKHKGIIRLGDLLSLDAHSKIDAEKFIKEILDDSIEGKWVPSSTSKRKKASQKK